MGSGVGMVKSEVVMTDDNGVSLSRNLGGGGRGGSVDF